jgi:hypothetical protein
MPLSLEHRRFLMVEQSLQPALFNLVLNAGIAWLLFRGNPYLTLWDEGEVGPDLLITSVLLPVLSCLIVTRIVSGQITSGKVPRLGAGHASASAGGWHRRSALARAGFLGVIGLVFGAVPAIALLTALGPESMTVGAFVTFKGLWTAALALAMSPAIAWWAILAASTEAPFGD